MKTRDIKVTRHPKLIVRVGIILETESRLWLGETTYVVEMSK